MEQKTKKNKYSIYRILAYFIIYSIVGFIVETIYGLLTKGTLESRQGFIYGPFCPIYGVGAVTMILVLQYFNKNKYTLFFGGFLVGSVIEYLLSFFMELVLNVKWWDYSNKPLNINGRICVAFSMFWGVLAIYLIAHFNPLIDKLLDKIKMKITEKWSKIVVIILSIFLLIDFIFTGVALKIFYSRLVYNYNLNIENAQEYKLQYENIRKYKKIESLTKIVWSDKKVLRTFPNLKLTSQDGAIIYVDSVLSNIQPYYLKIK